LFHPEVNGLSKLRIMMEMLMSMERAVINAAMVITVLAMESWMYRLANFPSDPNRNWRSGARRRLRRVVTDGMRKETPMRISSAAKKPKRGR
jgi:hypothetical protein